MSGFEVVGVLLGAIPLVISALEHYSEGISTMKNMKEYEYIFNDIHSSFAASVVIYKESCYMLLNPLSLQDDQMKDLLEDRIEHAWREATLRKALEKRLGGNCKVYLSLVDKLNRRILLLAKKLKLSADLRPPWIASDDSVDEIARQKFFGNVWRKIKGGFGSAECVKLLEKIDQDIFKISHLISSSIKTEPIRAENKRRQSSSSWKHVRDQAQRLFKTLSSQFGTCSCQQPHQANLRLDVRKDHLSEEDSVTFAFLFTFQKDACLPTSLPWDWRDIEIKTWESSTAAPVTLLTTTQSLPAKKTTRFAPAVTVSRIPNSKPLPAQPMTKIEALCTALTQDTQSRRCIGFLEDAPWQHHIYCLPDQPPQPQSTSPSPLKSLLCNPTPTTSLATREKCILALTLALAVLNLHDTPWLRQNWDTKDIYFLNRSSTSFTSNLYVSQTFSHSPPLDPKTPSRRLVKNETVFALGIALLELSFRAPLLSLLTPLDLNEQGVVDSLTEFSIATRLAGEIHMRELPNYARAVARCVGCDFDTFQCDFGEREFRERFYDGVVLPLKQDWEYAVGVGERP